MANVNNTSSYMDGVKKEIIKKSNYTYRDALEVSEYLIEKESLKDSIRKCKLII